MQKNDAQEVLEGEIVEDRRDGSLPQPSHPTDLEHGTQSKKPAGGWMEMIAAIGGGIVKWLASSFRTTPFGDGDGPGQKSGGGRMRRRRGRRG